MISVVLIKPQEPGNVGAIARAMGNFELKELILIDPLCNHLDDVALCRSKHAKNILEKAKVMPYDYFFNELKRDFDLIIGTTSVMGTDYNIPRTPITSKEISKKIDKKQKTAIIFGNEANGLSNEEIGNCDFVAAIPTSKKYRALNISHAAAIFFYELFISDDTENIISHIASATRKERDVIFSKIDFIVENLPFTTEEKKDTQKITWKRVIEKSNLSKREAFAIMGFLRKIEKKLSKS